MSSSVARQHILNAIEHLSWRADDNATIEAIGILTRRLEDALPTAAKVLVMPTRDRLDAYEREIAYYVAISFQPALANADPQVREVYLERARAGLRAAAKGINPRTDLDRRAHRDVQALMAWDDASREARVANGGW